jgi:uncharacterized protein YdaT
MPWSSNNTPPAMKNLSSSKKKKAVEIANAVLKESGDEGKAIAIALASVKKPKKKK